MFPQTGIAFASNHSAPRWIPAGLLLAIAALNPAIGAESAAAAPPIPAEADPWAFNLNLYMWLPGVDGKFSARPLHQSVDKSFIDIVDASHRFPLGVMGRFEAHYERFGLYLKATGSTWISSAKRDSWGSSVSAWRPKWAS